MYFCLSCGFVFVPSNLFSIKWLIVDLKPENILLTFDPRAGKCIDLKLCDFGLSTKFKSKQVLSDFCGSPGTQLFLVASTIVLNSCVCTVDMVDWLSEIR